MPRRRMPPPQTHPGSFGLENAKDLFAKLCADYDRFAQTDGTKAGYYAAFDFFVTAFHLHEWAQRTASRSGRKFKLSDYALVRDLANGAKHFGLSGDRLAPLTAPVEITGDHEPAYFLWIETRRPGERVENAIEVAKRILEEWRTVDLEPEPDRSR